MAASSIFRAVIADSSKLGSVMLERLLAPLLEVEVCRDPSALQGALVPAPQLLLIAHQWPDLEALLDTRIDGCTAVILMASPESDAARLATLCQRCAAGVIYRPYEARQVMREILQQLQRHRSESASDTTAAAPRVLHDLSTLKRDQAFCRRHDLPHSLLALRIDDYDNLATQLGVAARDALEQRIVDALTAGLRQEDHLCLQRPGWLVLSVPGTPVQGARVLAHRLCQHSVLEDTGTTLLAGVHLVTAERAGDLQRDIDQAMATCELAGMDGGLQVLLSDQACENLEQSIPVLGEEASSGHDDLPLLTESLAREPTNPATLEAVSRALRSLDEGTRMALVDELLLASSLPDA